VTDLKFQRDEAGINQCGVPTGGFLLRYWRGQRDGSPPVPVQLVRHAPNVVHYCQKKCKRVQTEQPCVHKAYSGLTPVLQASFARVCRCKPEAAPVASVKHACGGAGDTWLLSEVQLQATSRVQWGARTS
jgi:hypothetical protein